MPNTAAVNVQNPVKSAAKPSMIRKHLDQMKVYFQEVDEFPLEVEEDNAPKPFKVPFPVVKAPSLPLPKCWAPPSAESSENVSPNNENDDVALISNSPSHFVITPPKRKINVNLVSRSIVSYVHSRLNATPRKPALGFTPRSPAASPRKPAKNLFPSLQLTLADMPIEMIIHIFSFLRADELCLACQVCQDWRVLASDVKLWRPLHIKQFGVPCDAADVQDWKALYWHYTSEQQRALVELQRKRKQLEEEERENKRRMMLTLDGERQVLREFFEQLDNMPLDFE